MKSSTGVGHNDDGVVAERPTTISSLLNNAKKDSSASLSSDASTTPPTLATSIDPTAVTFVDYRRPPPPKVLPPAKYKLWSIVFVLVYFAIWCSELAGLVAFLRFDGWLSPDGAQFLALCLIIFVLVYAALDLFVVAFTFPWGGSPRYGVGPWLRTGRVEWVHNSRFSDTALFECLKCAIHIMEDGFGMFNNTPHHHPPGGASRAAAASPKPKPVSEGNGTNRVARRTRKDQKQDASAEGPEIARREDGSGETRDDGVFHREHDEEDDDDEDVYCSCTSDTCPTILKIEHHLNPDRMQDYERWQKRVERAVRLFPGFLSIKCLDVVSEELSLFEAETDSGDVETGAGGVATKPSLPKRKTSRLSTRDATPSMDGTNQPVKSNLHTIFVTFENVDSLNDWMLSPRRKALMKQLEPMLAVPSSELIQAERAHRDAFTALVTQQGRATPLLPPKKWKVAWLTTLALAIAIRWVEYFLPYYMEFWGLDENSLRLQSLVSTLILTFLNSYVCTPFLLFLFAPWLVRRSCEIDERTVWKLLDDGIKSIWVKLLLTVVFYGGCVLAWALRR